VNPSSCINDPNWTPKIRQSLRVPDLLAAKILMKEFEEYASRIYPLTVMFPEVADCWPSCEPELTGTKLNKYTSALCKY
jgi:hypothetical protein